MPRFARGGYAYQREFIPIELDLTTGATVRIAEPLGFRAELVSAKTFVKKAGTGSGATRGLTLGKNGTLTALATMTHTLAGTATLGAEVAATLAAGDVRQFSDTDVLNIGFASGGTAFTAGEVVLCLTWRVRLQDRS